MSNAVAQMFYDTLSNGNPNFIGLQNPGGTRDSFNAGDITYREAAMTLPFANSLFTTEITGAQFKTVLEQQWQRDQEGKVPSRPFLQLGLSDNVTYTYDETLEEGSRITSIMVNGKPIDPAAKYTVGSGSFLIAGGDNFWELAKGTNTKDTGRADLEAWVNWVADSSPLSPDYTKRGVSAKLADGTLVEGATTLSSRSARSRPTASLRRPSTCTSRRATRSPEARQPADPGLPRRSPSRFRQGDQRRGHHLRVAARGHQHPERQLHAGVQGARVRHHDPLPHQGGDHGQAEAHADPDPDADPAAGPQTLYTTPGVHRVNGRLWVTSCEPYSQTTRCRTEIWATQIRYIDGRFVKVNDFAFNNMTYLPRSGPCGWATRSARQATTWSTVATGAPSATRP
ncbi:5'-nucleotidase C-terminal domain-containing protein [Tessaracoccus coleopterorum]|uniref:5'-nucleotidase C-terminal domain-containing protein n=1 Tax=Tessaracoccus coleopterorum TaxID=2714950 RepID=UPI001E471309|nr:5'-nucleotidase [Tessaracoccus coleopterorum]